MASRSLNFAKIALRFAIYLIYLSSKLKPSNIYKRLKQFLNAFNYEQVHDYEKYIKIYIKTKLDLCFLETCWKQHLYSKFLQFKTSIPNYTGSKYYRISQRKALLFEIV